MVTNNSKVFITDVFVKGAINGWNLITHSTIPNVLMAFVIIKILNISGLLAIIGKVFSPIMMIFGLPGEAATVLICALPLFSWALRFSTWDGAWALSEQALNASPF